jgi:hypothetical protein
MAISKKTKIKLQEVIKTPTENASKIDIRNRKRGKGKIKIVKRQHVNSEELKNELIKFKKSGMASERLGEIFLDLVENLATKSSFSGYSYLEEMKSKAIFFLLKYSKNYDPDSISKRTNKKVMSSFAYCTQIAINAFIQVIKKETKHNEAVKGYIEKYFREKNFFKKDDILLN